MSIADDPRDDAEELPLDGAPGQPSSQGAVRVKLYVHGGTISFTMRWSGTLAELQDHFTRTLATKKAGMVIDSGDRLTHVVHGSVSAYDFAREPLGSGSPMAEVRPA